MDNNENRKDILPTDPNRRIQLVVNNNQEEGDTINLRNVFDNMKLKRRVFAWVLVLCLTIGVCVPLLLYQFNKPELIVSSLVTLRYEAPVKVLKKGENGEKDKWYIPDNPEYAPVEDLSAPDGTDLDLSQIISSFVLQTALDGMTLSRPITVSALRNNITVTTVLTEESARIKESLQGLAETKDKDAYTRLVDAEIKYQNRFVVSLTNGFFEDDESRVRTELKDAELRLLLDRILTVYNEYLVRTYADMQLPQDTFSVIDVQETDVADSLDQLRNGIDALYAYCNEKTDTVKSYRSPETGRNLNDWMETLQTFRSINIDYLYAFVNEDSITRNRAALLTSYKYQLRTAQNSLEEINGKIEETRKILASYKNDEVYISMQESDAAKTTQAATEYYNKLMLQQVEYYAKAAELKATVADYADRIARLENAAETEVTAEVEAELARALVSAQNVYDGIRTHMEEVFASPMYSTFEDHSAAQGKLPNFLVASLKKMIIGAIVGVILACGLWFMAGLLPEFSKGRKEEEKEKRSLDYARDDIDGKEADAE